MFAEALTEILGGPELFIDMGSTINLTCLVQYTPEPPPTLVWKHSQEVSTYNLENFFVKVFQNIEIEETMT